MKRCNNCGNLIRRAKKDDKFCSLECEKEFNENLRKSKIKPKKSKKKIWIEPKIKFCSFCKKILVLRTHTLINIAQNPPIHYFCTISCKNKWISQKVKESDLLNV